MCTMYVYFPIYLSDCLIQCVHLSDVNSYWGSKLQLYGPNQLCFKAESDEREGVTPNPLKGI